MSILQNLIIRFTVIIDKELDFFKMLTVKKVRNINNEARPSGPYQWMPMWWTKPVRQRGPSTWMPM